MSSDDLACASIREVRRREGEALPTAFVKLRPALVKMRAAAGPEECTVR